MVMGALHPMGLNDSLGSTRLIFLLIRINYKAGIVCKLSGLFRAVRWPLDPFCSKSKSSLKYFYSKILGNRLTHLI